MSKLREVERAAISFNLAEETKRVGEYYLQRERMKDLGEPFNFPIEHFLKFASKGLTATTQFVVTDSPGAFVDVPVETLMTAINSTALLEKICKRRKSLLAEAISLFQSQPQLSSELPGFLWVATKAKIEQLFPLLPELSDYAAGKAGNSDLLTALLIRDKSGKAISRLIVLSAKGEISMEPLVEGLRKSPIAAINFLRILPKLAARQYADHASRVLVAWLSHLIEVLVPERQMISGALAVLSGGFLQKKRLNPTEQAILNIIQSATEDLGFQIASDVQNFWVFLPLKREMHAFSAAATVSSEAARLIVESLLKLESPRYQPADVFQALALNLGLSAQGELGAQTDFNPDQHEDGIGGLLRGQPCEVVRLGWSFQSKTMLKTKVNPLNPHA